MLRLADKLLSIARRDLLTAVRYRAGFMLHGAGMLIEIVTFYYLARAVGSQFHPDGIAYFPFLLIGVSYATFLATGVSAFVHAVREAQVTGTMEVLMTTATPPYQIVLLSVLSTYGTYLASTLAFVGLGLALFHVPLGHPNLGGALLVLVLSILTAFSLGILAASFQVIMQKGVAFLWLLNTATAFLTGTMFPVSVLPRALQKLSMLIPVTHSLNGLRLALFRSAGLRELRGPVVALAVFSAVLLPLSILSFSWAVRRAKLEGSVAFY
jgi:ABC-2 type transport system permease protein